MKQRFAQIGWSLAAGGVLTLSIIVGAILTHAGLRTPDPNRRSDFDTPQAAPPHAADNAITNRPIPAGAVEPARLRRGIQLCADYLNRMVDERGRFVYRVNLDPEVRVAPKYNMLRHAGTIYALASCQQRYPNPQTLETLKRSVEFLLRESIAPVPERDGLLVVWSRPEITGGDAPLQAKLGGAGLALVALLSAEGAGVAGATTEQLRGLGRFLLWMQKPDGGFYSKYVPATGGRDDRWTSLYYPGEAALGLVMLYERDPDPRWLQAAADAIGYLARLRADAKTVEADHWALLATARLLPLYDRCQKPVPPEALLRHAAQISESIFLESRTRSPFQLSVRGFAPDGRTCPTATRLEGLHAAYSFLPHDQTDLRERIRAVLGPGVSFLLCAQVESGPFAGGIPRAIRRLPPTDPAADGTFNARATEIRIDYVQHTLSALLAHEELLGRPASD